MPSKAPVDLRDLGDYKHWKPEAQQRALDALRAAEQSNYRPFYCPLASCDGNPHGEWAWQHARQDQRPPRWEEAWRLWLLSGGRGSGKTRTGAEVTHQVTNYTSRICLIASTGPDFRDTMVEGISGILACSAPGKRPLWEPSKKQLTWPNGCIAQGFSAEEPDRLRGPQFGFTWADEPAHYAQIQAVWDNMLFGLRVKGKAKNKVLATSTPKPTKWLRKMIKDARTITTRVSTYANLPNLDGDFAQDVLERFEGTRTGRQELHGELLEDVEGALWQWEMIHYAKVDPTLLKRIVVGVDPAGTANKKSDETGIIVVGIGVDNTLYVLADFTGKYSPAGWAKKANDAYELFSADAIVAEKNYGADMVRHTLESSGYRGARVILVDSRRGKMIRAEPIVALYEKLRVYHVGERGVLSKLDDELTTWVPNSNDASPNRIDALVHAATNLAKSAMPASISSPTQIQGRLGGGRHLRAVG